jgi:putative methyltransferase (TIGR04325 family)
MGIRQAVAELLPAWIIDTLSRLLRRPGFYGDYATFDAALAVSTGYNTAAIAQVVATWRHVPAIDLHAPYQHVLAALAPVLIGREHLSVLDVGGGCGMYFYALRPFLPPLTWTILETPEMVRACANGEIRYVEDAAQLIPPYNVVLLSTVLPYLRDPYAEFTRFAGMAEYLILARLPLWSRDRLTVETPSRYAASYPAWFLDEAKLLQAVRAHGVIRMRWSSKQDALRLDGRKIVLQGMLIQRTDFS